MRTVERTLSGGFLITSPASSRATSRYLPLGATRLIRLALNASSAVKKRPVSAASIVKAPPPR